MHLCIIICFSIVDNKIVCVISPYIILYMNSLSMLSIIEIAVLALVLWWARVTDNIYNSFEISWLPFPIPFNTNEINGSKGIESNYFDDFVILSIIKFKDAYLLMFS